MNGILRSLILIKLLICASAYGITENEDYKIFEERFKSTSKELDRTVVISNGAKQLYNKMSSGILGSGDLSKMHNAAADYAKSLDKINIIIDEFQWLASVKTRFEIRDFRPSKFQTRRDFERKKDRLKPGKANLLKRRAYLNPLDEEGMITALNMKMTLASALILYDNFDEGFKPYQSNKKLRRTINKDNVEIKGLLEHISGAYRSLENFGLMRRAIKRTNQIMLWESNNPESTLALNGYNTYLNELITNTKAYKRFSGRKLHKIIVQKVRNHVRKRRDNLHAILTGSTNLLSLGFGNAIGTIATRSGKLDDISSKEIQRLESEFEPLDILLEKTPFRFTDKFIPGHWGHVAIWVGNEQQLKELGVWEELDEINRHIRKYHDYEGPHLKKLIRKGNMVLEALRPGVQINSLKHFMNIDDLAVLRHRLDLSKEKKKEYLLRAFKQVGKDYDFNFDVQTDKKIVCSELAYVVFYDLKWPTEETLGRYTISPDHVALKAKKDGVFKPVVIFHDGKEIVKSLQDNFDYLLAGQYDKVKF